MDFFQKVIDVLLGSNEKKKFIPDRAGVLITDIFGYDGWTAEATLRYTMGANVPKRYLATLCHAIPEKRLVRNTLGKVLHNACRAKEFAIEGFPDLANASEKLQNLSKAGVASVLSLPFSLCTTLPDGTLIIPQAISNRWLEHSMYSRKAQKLIESHDKEFNKEHKRDVCDEDQANEPPSRRTGLEALVDDEITTIEKFKSKFPNGTMYEEGSVTWMSNSANVSDGSIWVAAPDTADVTICDNVELWSFGSGTWEEGNAAADLYQDLDSAWLALKFDGDTPIILENTTDVPEKVKTFSYVSQGQVVPVQQLLTDLECAGEMRVKLTGHKTVRENTAHKVEQEAEIAFKLEAKAKPSYTSV